MQTLLYAGRAEPKSIYFDTTSREYRILLNYVAYIGSFISLLRKIFGIYIFIYVYARLPPNVV